MFISKSAEETRQFGRTIGEGTQAGDILALVGDLGAGKTELVKGIVAAVGSSADVTSPTFTILHEYNDGRIPVFHFDLYRMRSPDEAVMLGFDDYLFGDGVTVVEWADRFPTLIPATAQWWRLANSIGEGRKIERLSPL